MSRSRPSERSDRLIKGRYRIEESLGRGGMAAVYRVRDTKSGHTVALKRSWARDRTRALERRTLLEREFYPLRCS